MPLRTLRKNHNAGAIERLVKQGGLYAGASAGAIIAGRSIHSCEIKGWDDPGVGEGWDLGATSRGLDSFNLLVGGASVFPHFSPGWAQPIAAAAAESRRACSSSGKRSTTRKTQPGEAVSAARRSASMPHHQLGVGGGSKRSPFAKPLDRHHCLNLRSEFEALLESGLLKRNRAAVHPWVSCRCPWAPRPSELGRGTQG